MPHDRLWKPGPQTHVLRTEHAHAATSQRSLKQGAPVAAAHSVDTALGWQGATSTEHAHATTSRGSLQQSAPEAAAQSMDTSCLLNRLFFSATDPASAWRALAAAAAAVAPGDNVAPGCSFWPTMQTSGGTPSSRARAIAAKTSSRCRRARGS